MAEQKSEKPVLVAGATGYIGGRLVPKLLEAGYRVRALARSPAKLQGRPWASHPHLDIAAADLLDRSSLEKAATGCGAAFYLVHSMDPQVVDFAETDRQAARNMALAAAACGLERIVYLGGLGEEGSSLSDHLQSRAEVGDLLREGPVPVTVLRAAMIIGSGSASFEILRYLVERLPIMVAPRWIETPCQPIGVRNVLAYLVGCLGCPDTVGATFDIGQEEVVSYRRLMEIYAEEAGLRRRLVISVPILSPRLDAFWIHLMTPVPAALARPLVEGLQNPVDCSDTRIRQLIPQPLLSCREAIGRALERTRHQDVESFWADAGAIPPAEWSQPGDPGWAGGSIFEDRRCVILGAAPQEIWPALQRIGGRTGWYASDWLWGLRGVLDRLAGGVGLSRGRRSSVELRPGDALDFWRVVAVEEPRRLLLVAEMKLPGKAVLELTLLEKAPGETELRLTARFLPRGLTGLLYWWGVTPFHGLAFNGMLRGIAKAAGRPVLAGPQRLEKS